MRKVLPRGEGQQCFRIVLTQGLNRQIRNMVEAASKGAFRVTYLRRVRVGPVHIDDICADGCDEPVEILGTAREALLAWAFSSHAQRREREE